MMSNETTDTTFTERGEDGDFTIDIVAYVANSRIFINFSSPEHGHSGSAAQLAQNLIQFLRDTRSGHAK